MASRNSIYSLIPSNATVPTSNSDIPAWRDLAPDVPPKSEKEELRLADGAGYIASRGPDGIDSLKSWIQLAKGQRWLKLIKVHGAVANNWTVSCRLLLTDPDVQSDVNAVDKNGYTPLHFAVIWGRPSMVVLLLSLKADFTIETPEGLTPFDMSRQRMNKLLAPRLNRHDDIKNLREEGAEIVDILEGVFKANAYTPWAEQQINNRYVQRHSPFLIANAQRYSLAILRELIMQEKAMVLTSAQVMAKEREISLRKAEEEKLLAGPPLTLEEAMTKAHLLDENPKVIMRQMHKLLEVRTLADLNKVSREDIAELDEITAAERRALWLFASSHHTKTPQKGNTELKGGGGVSEKTKKTKKKKDTDLDLLLQEGVKTKPMKPKPKPLSKTAVSNTTAGTHGVKFDVPEAPKKEVSSLSSKKQGGDDEDPSIRYTRHWMDQQSPIKFLFRSDLPSDAFTVIAHLLYS